MLLCSDTERSVAKPPLGSGSRFAALEAKLAGKKGVTDPAGLAAYIGRKKYSKKGFQKLSAKGRKRHKKMLAALGKR